MSQRKGWYDTRYNEETRRQIEAARTATGLNITEVIAEAVAQLAEPETLNAVRLENQRKALAARVDELVADNQRLEAECNKAQVAAECMGNDIEAAVSALEHAGLVEPDECAAHPLTDDCTRIERVIRRYKHVCELKEATEVTAQAAQANYAEACQHRDRAEKESTAARARVEELEEELSTTQAALKEARSDLADMERQRNAARGERTAATIARDDARRSCAVKDQTIARVEAERDHLRSDRDQAVLQANTQSEHFRADRDRVRRERDKALSELAERDLGIGRAGWWVIGILCGTAGTLAATWLASGGLG